MLTDHSRSYDPAHTVRQHREIFLAERSTALLDIAHKLRRYAKHFGYLPLCEAGGNAGVSESICYFHGNSVPKENCPVNKKAD
jgi:hypothetical protein